MAENLFILRVMRESRDSDGWNTTPVHCGTAVYLGGRYALTCWHVIVEDEECREKEHAAQWCDLYQFTVASAASETESERLISAKVQRVVAESPRCALDLALLELDQELPIAGLRLLSQVGAEFMGNLNTCDEIYACGVAGRTDGGQHSIAPIDPGRLQNQRYRSNYLVDLQLTGSLPFGYSGAALICILNSKAGCLGLSWLGGEPASTSRFATSDVIINQFLKLVIGQEELQDFVIPAEFLIPSDGQLESELLETYRCGVQGDWDCDFQGTGRRRSSLGE